MSDRSRHLSYSMNWRTPFEYQHLGLDRFAECYVRGFLKHGSYEEIPLEEQAYELEDQFVRDPAARFSVEADVMERIRQNQF